MKHWVFLITLILSTMSFGQSVYRWVDKDGKVFYSDQPPPADAKSSQQKRLGSGITIDEDQTPYAVQVAVKKNPVIAYLTNCGELCDSARALLAKRGIPYTARDPEKNTNDAAALRKQIGGLEVPVMMVGETQVKGFDEANWNAALDAGGYPRLSPFIKAPVPKKSEPAAPAAPTPASSPAAAPPAQDGKENAPQP